ncbi:MAG: DUF4058 family protein [Anaerolineaceae bacterium]|nr:DUF4058 family protein [Anaerolineaceae bacterium]
MAIKFRKNIYHGVNAHLNSLLQHEYGGWEVFHNSHITDILRAVDVALPVGYLAEAERGLQIRTIQIDEEDAYFRMKRPRPDITIHHTDPIAERKIGPLGLDAAIPTREYPALASLEYGEDVYLNAVVIREILETGEIGKPITWIELLSPTNKPPGQGFVQYREKRITALKSGIALVEIDYLHETRSPISNSLSYLDREDGATPYMITITNPRPDLQLGRTQEFGFHVDQAIPTVKIPLKGTDSITVNFQTVYNQTYESIKVFSYRVDYDSLPVGMDNYDATDQKQILAVMERAKNTTANPE